MILGKLFFFKKKNLKKNVNSQKHQLTLTLFYCLIKEIRLGDSAISHTRENSKCLTSLQIILAILTLCHLQAESCI